MTYTPTSITDLMDFIRPFGTKHGVKRYCDPNRNFFGYHLGKDQIFSSSCKDAKGRNRAMGWEDYSVKTPRDKKGLTNARSALDIQLPKSALQKFTNWLVKECLANKPDTRDIREIVYSPDGTAIRRYDAVTNTDKPSNAALSHRTHTHIGFFRDSENRDKRDVFRRYFTPTKETDLNEVEVLQLQRAINAAGHTPKLKVDGELGPLTLAGLAKLESLTVELTTELQITEKKLQTTGASLEKTLTELRS